MTVEDWLIDRLKQKWNHDEDAKQYNAYVDLLRLEKKGLLDAFVDFVADESHEYHVGRVLKPDRKP